MKPAPVHALVTSNRTAATSSANTPRPSARAVTRMRAGVHQRRLRARVPSRGRRERDVVRRPSTRSALTVASVRSTPLDPSRPRRDARGREDAHRTTARLVVDSPRVAPSAVARDATARRTTTMASNLPPRLKMHHSAPSTRARRENDGLGSTTGANAKPAHELGADQLLIDVANYVIGYEINPDAVKTPICDLGLCRGAARSEDPSGVNYLDRVFRESSVNSSARARNGVLPRSGDGDV